MENQKRKYEKPICIDAGKVAHVLGAKCSAGAGASDSCINYGGDPGNGDCSVGYGNAVVPSCNVGGGHKYCDAAGNSATRVCDTGSSPLGKGVNNDPIESNRF